MATPNRSSSDGVTPVAGTRLSLDQRKRQLSDLLEKKVEQGYRVESQADTTATVVTKGHRGRLFGLFSGGRETRQTLSVDERGHATTRTA